jgi:hypothetical protein
MTRAGGTTKKGKNLVKSSSFSPVINSALNSSSSSSTNVSTDEVLQHQKEDVINEAGEEDDSVHSTVPAAKSISDNKKITTNLTTESMLKSFNSYISEHYSGDLDEFFEDINILISKAKGTTGSVSGESFVTEDDPNSVHAADISASQLFETHVLAEGNAETKKWLQSMRLPSTNALNVHWTTDLMHQQYADLIRQPKKDDPNPIRKSFTTFLNAVSYFQCFIKPLHLSSIEWKGLKALIVNYVIDKIFHFMIAKKVVFKVDDYKRVRNENGTYTHVASSNVKKVLGFQFKQALNKRESYKKNHTITTVQSGSEGEGSEDSEDSEDSGDDEDGEELDEEILQETPLSTSKSKHSAARSKPQKKKDEEKDDEESSGDEEDEDDMPLSKLTAKRKKEKATSNVTSETTPQPTERSSPRKRKNEEAPSESSAPKKVIITKPFPNNPNINYRYEFFEKTKNNAVRAQALIIREKSKIQTPPSAAKNTGIETSSNKKN